MSGGGLSASNSEYVGNNGEGTFTQTGGTNNLGSSGQIYLGNGNSSGTYNLSGSGVISGNDEWLGYRAGGSGSFVQSGGTNNLAQMAGFSSAIPGQRAPTVSARGLLSAPQEYVGDGGSGSFTQLGGTNLVTGPLYVGFFSSASGTYGLSGGSLSVPSSNNEYLGYSARGTSRNRAGRTVAAILVLPMRRAAVASYSLSGNGHLAVSVAENVAQSGTGSFTQSGGTNATAQYLDLGNTAGASGTYSLAPAACPWAIMRT